MSMYSVILGVLKCSNYELNNWTINNMAFSPDSMTERVQYDKTNYCYPEPLKINILGTNSQTN